MAAVLHRWIAIAAVGGVAACWWAAQGIDMPPSRTAEPPRTASSRQAQAHCVDGAVLVHDVRWAAACTALAEQGQGDGIADCDLPDDRAATLYAMLQEAERSCAAEARE